MRYILSHPRLTVSAERLAAKLSERLGEKVMVRTTSDSRGGCIIRYGNSSRIIQLYEVELNSPELIRLAGNKRSLSSYLIGMKFPHVEIFSSDDDKIPEDKDYPIIVRKELNRGGGIGIEIHETPEKPFTFGDYWGRWYNFQFELGVHILGGQIVRVFKKIRSPGLDPERFPIRNTQRGYSFSLRENWAERYTGLKGFVDKLYSLVPIQFSRLDVGYDKETGGYRLIEINSAPDLSQNENTLNLYAEFLSRKLGLTR